MWPSICDTHLRITIYCTSITLMQRALHDFNNIIKLKTRHTRTDQIDNDVTALVFDFDKNTINMCPTISGYRPKCGDHHIDELFDRIARQGGEPKIK